MVCYITWINTLLENCLQWRSNLERWVQNRRLTKLSQWNKERHPCFQYSSEASRKVNRSEGLTNAKDKRKHNILKSIVALKLMFGHLWQLRIPADLVLALQTKSLTNILLPGKHLSVFLAVILTLLSAVGKLVYVFWPKKCFDSSHDKTFSWQFLTMHVTALAFSWRHKLREVRECTCGNNIKPLSTALAKLWPTSH